jgi:hypothetical protein
VWAGPVIIYNRGTGGINGLKNRTGKCEGGRGVDEVKNRSGQTPFVCVLLFKNPSFTNQVHLWLIFSLNNYNLKFNSLFDHILHMIWNIIIEIHDYKSLKKIKSQDLIWYKTKHVLVYFKLISHILYPYVLSCIYIFIILIFYTNQQISILKAQ